MRPFSQGMDAPAAASFPVRAHPDRRTWAMDIGRDIRTYTIEPLETPVPARTPLELPAQAPAEPVPAGR